eukprot:914997-Pyramimonas_sp.AAC.2
MNAALNLNCYFLSKRCVPLTDAALDALASLLVHRALDTLPTPPQCSFVGASADSSSDPSLAGASAPTGNTRSTLYTLHSCYGMRMVRIGATLADVYGSSSLRLKP